jgi:hypothetical protein
MEYGALWNVFEGGRPKYSEKNLPQCFKFMHKTTENFGMDSACIKSMYIPF